ncbi:hypothetical protein TWF696_003697 [Orbilia brochopaga]|uniref:Uncharacterized protein n=1 Tax=Orbilia brochopaga TaxID=3140254 RepID=A0AAV9V4S1_9PEZI
MRSQEILEYRPWALNSLGQAPATETRIAQNTLEARVIALETKLRHSNPDHPCDCKYELSLLEEKLGTLRQHPWERRLSQLEAKQKRDTLDLSKVYDEFQEHQAKVDQLIQDCHWDYDSEERINNVVKSTNIIYIVERMLTKMKRFDKYRVESEECIRALKTRYERMTMDSQDWSRDMNHTQASVTDELHELRNEAKQLKEDVTDLRYLKEKLAEDLRCITKKLDRKVEELENTINSIARTSRASNPESKQIEIAPTQDTHRTTWVPPTSERPIQTPYPYNIPTFMKQPDGWSDIRAEVIRNLEETQRIYYSSPDKIKADEEIRTAVEVSERMSPGIRLASVDLSELDDSLPRRRKRKKKRFRSNLATTATVASDDIVAHMDTNLVPEDLQLPIDDVEEVGHVDPIASPMSSETTSDTKDTPTLETRVPEVTIPASIFNRSNKELVLKKSKSSLRKQKSKKSLKERNKPKYARLDEIFKQGKGFLDQSMSVAEVQAKPAVTC